MLKTEESIVLSQAYNEVMRRTKLCNITGLDMDEGKIVEREDGKKAFKTTVKKVYKTLMEIRREIENE